MKKSNKELMESALGLLKGNWRIGVKVTLIYFLISMLLRLIPFVGFIASIVITGPFALGLTMFWIAFSRKEDPKYDMMFNGFNTWWRAFVAYVLMFVYGLLWSLLLIIPGIIAMFSYALTYYILADDKTIGVDDAITKSKKMMKGNKWRLFCLELRFLGWLLLCIPTLGIGLLWLMPYVQVTMAKFYEDIKNGGTDAPKIPEITPVPVASTTNIG